MRFFGIKLVAILVLALSTVAHARTENKKIVGLSLTPDKSISGRINLNTVSPAELRGVVDGDYKVVAYIHVPGDIWYVHPFRDSDMNARFRSPIQVTQSCGSGWVGKFTITTVNRVSQPAREDGGDRCDECGAGQAFCGRIRGADKVAVFLVPSSFDESTFCGTLLPASWRGNRGYARAVDRIARDCGSRDKPLYYSDMYDLSIGYGTLVVDPRKGDF
jgi:hypothetical protein